MKRNDFLAVYRLILKVALVSLGIELVESILTRGPSDVIATKGSTVVLPCYTNLSLPVMWQRNQADGSESWSDIYQGKPGVITILYKDRFSVSKDSTGNQYNLTIANVQLKDAGAYRCSDYMGNGLWGYFRGEANLALTAELVVVESYFQCNGHTERFTEMPLKPEVHNSIEEINMNCSVTFRGNIQPDIQWRFVRKIDRNDSLLPHQSVQNISSQGEDSSITSTIYHASEAWISYIACYLSINSYSLTAFNESLIIVLTSSKIFISDELKLQCSPDQPNTNSTECQTHLSNIWSIIGGFIGGILSVVCPHEVFVCLQISRNRAQYTDLWILCCVHIFRKRKQSKAGNRLGYYSKCSQNQEKSFVPSEESSASQSIYPIDKENLVAITKRLQHQALTLSKSTSINLLLTSHVGSNSMSTQTMNPPDTCSSECFASPVQRNIKSIENRPVCKIATLKPHWSAGGERLLENMTNKPNYHQTNADFVMASLTLEGDNNVLGSYNERGVPLARKARSLSTCSFFVSSSHEMHAVNKRKDDLDARIILKSASECFLFFSESICDRKQAAFLKKERDQKGTVLSSYENHHLNTSVKHDFTDYFKLNVKMTVVGDEQYV